MPREWLYIPQPIALKGKQVFEVSADLPYMARTHTFASAIQLDMSGQELAGGFVKKRRR